MLATQLPNGTRYGLRVRRPFGHRTSSCAEDIDGRSTQTPQVRVPEKRTLLGTIFARMERRKEPIGLIVTIVVLALCGFALQRLLAEMHLADVRAAIAALPIFAILASIAFTAASFATLVGYDWSALRHLGQEIPLRVMALASFCGYAIGNTVGLALLTGGSVRFRIYTAAGMSSEDVGRVTLFCVVAFGFGVSAMSGLQRIATKSPFEHAECPGCSVTDRQPDACRRRRRFFLTLCASANLALAGVSVPLLGRPWWLGSSPSRQWTCAWPPPRCTSYCPIKPG